MLNVIEFFSKQVARTIISKCNSTLTISNHLAWITTTVHSVHIFISRYSVFANFSMGWNSSLRNTTDHRLSCLGCFANENNLILLQFTLQSRPTKIICSMLLILIIIMSVLLNTSSIYFIWHEMRRRTHVNLLLSSQSLADLAVNLAVMLPISIFALNDTHSKPSYYICLVISVLDHWLHSVTMVTMAVIIADRYKVIVQRQLNAITRRTEKSMAITTVIWSTTFVLSIGYVAPYLRNTDWGSSDLACIGPEDCYHSVNVLQWIDEIVNRLVPFTVIFYCFFIMIWLTYKSRHRVGFKNSMANWKTVLVGIYAKSVNTCLIIMTLFLIGTFPQLAMSMAVNMNKSVNGTALLFATWMRFSMTVLKPGIYMMQSGKKFSYCWFSACCRNVNITKLMALTKRPNASVMHSINQDVNFKVSFTKTHDLFSINLHIEDPDISTSSGQSRNEESMLGDMTKNKGRIAVRTISVITK